LTGGQLSFRIALSKLQTETNMALKESNKNRIKPEVQSEEPVVDSEICGYVTRLVLGPLLILGGILLIINNWVLPNL
jgi:hypothetical protein